jgi:uncharacterized protein
MEQDRPAITYPCEWIYKIIGTDEVSMRLAVDSIIQPETFEIHGSHTSRTGKYISLEVRLVVFTEEERHRYFQGLGRHKDIRIVL